MKLATKLYNISKRWRKREEERKKGTLIDRTNDSPEEPVVYNEADEKDSGANEIVKKEDERRGASEDTIARTDP